MFGMIDQIVSHAELRWLILAGPATVLLSAISGMLFAIWNISTNKAISRTRSTIELLEQSELSHRHQELVHSFAAAAAVEDGFLRLLDPNDELSHQHKQNVIALLNHYEIISIGIRYKTLDPKISRSYLRSIFLTRWEQAQPFIMKWRTGKYGSGRHKDLCSYFEKVVISWKA